MPVKVVKKGDEYLIVEKDGTVKGRSKSKEKAEASARIRNAATEGKMALRDDWSKDAVEQNISVFQSLGFSPSKSLDLSFHLAAKQARQEDSEKGLF